MADNKRTSEEDAAGALDGTELVRIVQGGVSKRTTAAALAALAGSGSDVIEIAGPDGGIAYVQQFGASGGALRVVVQLVAYFNAGAAQTQEFPTGFLNTPVAVANSYPACSADADTLSLPAGMAGAADGLAIFEGF